MASGDGTGFHPSSTSPADRVPAPRLQPPGASPPPGDTSVVYAWLWAALVLALLLSVAVIVLLPQLVSRDSSTRVAGPSAAPPSAPAADETSARVRAGEALQAYLRLRARLELAHGEVWGEPQWSEAGAAASDGDRLFARRHFTEAAHAYGKARQRLEALAGAREQRLVAALDAGREALQNDDGTAAAGRFTLALAIEPGNAEAAHALERARVRAEVLRLQQAGRDAEAAGDLSAAVRAYQEAAKQDPEYLPAAAALNRVTQQQVRSDFRAAMSRALAALDAGRLTAAGSALDTAARLRPDDGAVRDARQRLAGARLQRQLDGLRRRAAARSASEDWAAAAELYRQALALDPQAGFARDGLDRAQDRVRLHQQLDHYVDHPSRLYSAEPLANAERLLAAAGEAPEREPRLATKIGQVRRQITLARTPVPVELQSDGKTTVVIYHVGRLGRFRDHHLELLPGTYTAVGSRPGYRDARTVFTVRPGAAPLSIEIRCQEPV